MIPTLDGCNTRTITTNIQHYCRSKQHLHYHHCTTRKICTRNSMRLASYLGQLTTCMRPYESKHPTSSNSLEIGCGKSEVRLQFPFLKKISSCGRLIISVIQSKLRQEIVHPICLLLWLFESIHVTAQPA